MKKIIDWIIRIKQYLDFVDGKTSYIPKQKPARNTTND